jgi:hypothetical protein
MGTVFDTIRENEDPQFPFYPWRSEAEHALVQFMTTSGLSQEKINEMICIWVSSHLEQLHFCGRSNCETHNSIQNMNHNPPLSFSTAHEMFERIYKYMDKAPAWKTDTFYLPDAPNNPITFFYRDPVECAQFLVANPTFSECEDYAPTKSLVELSDGGWERAYHEMRSGQLWNKLQVSKQMSLSLTSTLPTLHIPN